MTKRKKILLYTFLVTIPLLLVGLHFLLTALLHTEWMKSKIEHKISDVLGSRVQVGKLSGSLWGDIEVDSLSIDGMKGDIENFLKINQARIDYQWLKLIRADFGQVTLVNPQIRLVLDKQGQWNLPPKFLTESDRKSLPVLPSIGIENGFVSLSLPDASYAITNLQGALSHSKITPSKTDHKLILKGELADIRSSFTINASITQAGSQFDGDARISVPDISLERLSLYVQKQIPQFPVIKTGKAKIESHISKKTDRIQADGKIFLNSPVISTASGTVSPGDILISADGLSADRKRFNAEKIMVDLGPLGKIKIGCQINLDPQKSFQFVADVNDFDIASAENTFSDWLPSNYVSSGKVQSKISASGSLKELIDWSVGGAINSASFSSPFLKTFPLDQPLLFSGKGTFDSIQRNFQVQEGFLKIGNIAYATAEANIITGTKGLETLGHFDINIPSLASLPDWLVIPAAAGYISDITGSAIGSGDFSIRSGSPTLKGQFKLNQAGASGPVGQINNLDLESRFQVQSISSFQAEATAEIGLLQSHTASGRNLRLSLFAKKINPDLLRGKWSLDTAQASIPLSTAFSIPVHDVQISSDIDIKQDFINIKKGLIKGDGLPDMTFAANALLSSPRSVSIYLQAKEIDWSKIYADWEPKLESEYQSWWVDGKSDFEIDISAGIQPNKFNLQSQINTNIKNMNFFSADAEKAASNLNASVSGIVQAKFNRYPDNAQDKYRMNLKTLDWNLNSSFQGEEFLFGTLYQNLKGLASTIQSKGKLLAQEDRIQDASIQFYSPKLGRLYIESDIEQISATPSMNTSLHLSQFNLDLLHKRFFEEGLVKEWFPDLAGYVFSGSLDSSLVVSGNREDWSIGGEIHLEDGFFEKQGSIPCSITNVELSMPFRLASQSPATSSNQAPEIASLKFDKLNLGQIPIQTEPLLFTLDQNNLNLSTPALLMPASGTLNIREFSLSNLLSPNRELVLEAELSNFALKPLTEQLKLPVIEGTLSAKLPRFITQSGDFLAQGPIEVQIFNGNIVLNPFKIHDVFTANPELKFSMSFEDIDLLPLTTVLQYGRATGIIDGSVQDFIWQPSGLRHFDLNLESIRKRGISQEISVDLIEVITESGTGLDPMQKAIIRRSEVYKYKRIGCSARLDDGRLFIEGTIPKKDKQLFMEGALFGGIDIALYTPKAGMPFQEFIRRVTSRIESLKKSGGPEVR